MDHSSTDSKLARLLHGRTGIVIQEYQQGRLRQIVERACERFGYQNLDQYLAALERQPASSPELQFLVTEITVGESFFFREPAQLDFLMDVWLPQLVERKRRSGSKSLRIWSAGCSSGEEIYTLAMLLRERLADLESWTLHLLGTDINVDFLSQAVRGCFTEWSLRSTPDSYRRKCFFSEQGRHWILPELRNMCEFRYLNLFLDSFPSILSETHAMDLILCRNVFIYFDRRSIAPVIQKFQDSLVPGGILLFGSCDPTASGVSRLTRRRHGSVIYFQAGENGQKLPASPIPKGALPLGDRIPARPPAWLQPPAGPRAEPPASPKSFLECPAPQRSPAPAAESERRPQRQATISELLQSRRWHEVVQAVDASLKESGDSADLLRLKAKALANLGDLQGAAQLCERSLSLDRLHKETHFLKGLVMLELKRMPEAEAALRTTIYLDNTFLEAHYQLGLLRFANGDGRSGLKSLNNALKLAQRADPDQEVQNSSGMTYGRLATILANEIRMFRIG